MVYSVPRVPDWVTFGETWNKKSQRTECELRNVEVQIKCECVHGKENDQGNEPDSREKSRHE